MTDLFIGGVKAVLSDSFSTTVKVENSFFTKNGEYTYDVKLPLDNKTNSTLYNFLNRTNDKSQIATKRKAVLIADNRVYIDGTEIITGWTDKEVSLQLVSGKSELNYLIGSGLKIEWLELGKEVISVLRQTINGQSIYNRYPTYDYVLAPIMNRTTGVLMNPWMCRNDNRGWYLDYTRDYSTIDKFIPQPYLCAMIKKICSALGYSIGTNEIENSIFKDLYICHTEETNEYAKMLPGWTVKDFFTEIENTFNIVFNVNNRKKTIDILFANSYLVSAKEVHIQNAVDDYETEIDEDNRLMHSNSTVKYDLPSNSYFNRRKLSEAVLALCSIVDKASWAEVSTYLNTNKPAREIVRDTQTGREYIYDSTTSNIEMVNDLSDLKCENTDEEMTLSIMPVELTDYTLNGYNYINHITNSTTWKIPVVDGSGIKDESDESKTISDLLTDGVTETSSSKGKIFVAFYQGLKNPSGWVIDYPTPFTDGWCKWLGNFVQLSENLANMRLQELNNLLYKGAYEIDTTAGATFTCYDPNLYNPRLIFNIKNKRYACHHLEYVITNKGRDTAFKGIFYPIKISDIDVYKKFVLADGMWRDGGAWIDNGRWLDE